MKQLTKFEAANGTSFFPTYLALVSITKDVEEVLGIKATEVWSIISNDDIETWFFDKEDWNKLCKKATDLLEEDKLFGERVEKEIEVRNKKLRACVDKCKEARIKKASNKELLEIVQQFCQLTQELRAWGWVPNLVNMGEDNIVERAKKELAKNKNIEESERNSIFAKLTTPTKTIRTQEANITLLKLVKKIQKEKNTDKQEEIKKFLEKYAFLNYYYKGPAMSFEDVIAQIEEREKEDVDKKIQEAEEYNRKTREDQEQIFREKNIEKETERKLKEIQRMTYLKAHRKEVMTYSNYKIRIVLEEIAKRLQISVDNVRMLLPQEMKNALLDNKIPQKDELKERAKEMIIIARYGDIELEKDQSKIMKLKVMLEKKEKLEGNILKGQCAYPGKARGIVRRVDFKQDMKQFNRGEILLSRSTNPEIIMAMEKAAAIITDMGGISCHAAIVSREMKKPCVIGTKIATKVLKDGDLVEVDAEKGIITVLKS